jgi:hypothetical protein
MIIYKMSAYDKYDVKRSLDDVYSANPLLWTDVRDNVSPSWLTPYEHNVSSQGKYLKKQQKIKVNLDKIQESSGEWIGAKFEGFENQQVDKNIDDIITNIQLLQDKFDYTYQQYQNAYDVYNNKKAEETNKLAIFKDYIGRVLLFPDGSYYYMNKYGYLRRIDKNTIPASVTVRSISDNWVDIFKKVDEGKPQTNIPLDLEGKVVVTLKDNIPTYLWIDKSGLGHKLLESNSCDTTTRTPRIKPEEYDSIPIGSPVERCNVYDNSTDDILVLNKQLISLSLEIENKIGELANIETNYSQGVQSNKQLLGSKRSELIKHRKRMGSQLSRIRRLEGEYMDNKALYNSEYVKYVGLTGLTMALGGYLIYKWMS